MFYWGISNCLWFEDGSENILSLICMGPSLTELLYLNKYQSANVHYIGFRVVHTATCALLWIYPAEYICKETRHV